MDCRVPGSSAHGISQARVLEWVAISSSRGGIKPKSPVSPALLADSWPAESSEKLILCLDFISSSPHPLIFVMLYLVFFLKKKERKLINIDIQNSHLELWCWRRLLRVPWTARRSNQSILKEISPEYSLEGLMLKLKLQYFGHLMRRTDLLEKTLMLGKTEGGRRRGRQRMR